MHAFKKMKSDGTKKYRNAGLYNNFGGRGPLEMNLINISIRSGCTMFCSASCEYLQKQKLHSFSGETIHVLDLNQYCF